MIITGGGTSIGAAIAKAFASAGAKAIGLIGRRENHLKTSAQSLSMISKSTKVEYAVADITDKATLNDAFSRFGSSLGRIDVLVSNAAYLPDIVPVTDSDDEDWWSGFEINVKRTYNVFHSFLPHAAPNAVFLRLNARLATTSPIPGLSSYISSKIAVARLLECMQVEHPEIRIVSVHPGVVETAMTDKTWMPPMDDCKFPKFRDPDGY